MITGMSGFRGSQGWCLSAGNPPPSAFFAGPGQVLVGFDDYYKPGTDPFPCRSHRAVILKTGLDIHRYICNASFGIILPTYVGEPPPAAAASSASQVLPN
jgi:hypothetical protein